MPTITKTIGSGGDFADIPTWSLDFRNNTSGFYSNGDTAVGQLLNGFTASAGDRVWSIGATTAVTLDKVILEPFAGLEHNGVPGDGLLLDVLSTNREVIWNSAAANYDVEIRNLELENPTGAGTAAVVYWRDSGGKNLTLKRCLIHAPVTSTGWGVYGRGSGATIIMNRCIIYGCDAGTGYYSGNVPTWYIYNCTFDDCTTYGVDSSGFHVSNTTCMGCGTDMSGTWGTVDKNLTSDATAVGSTNYPSETRTSIFTDPANEDWTLQDGTNARDTGNTITSDDNDIDIANNNVAAPYDLGAHEKDAAPATTTTTTGAPTTTTTGGPTTTTTAGPTTTTTTAAPSGNFAINRAGHYVGPRQLNSTTYPVVFFMPQTADGKTGVTGLTVTMWQSKNGGSLEVAAGSVSEIGYGAYAFAGNSGDRDTVGVVDLFAEASGANAWHGHLLITTDDWFAEQFGAIKGDSFVKGTHGLDQQASVPEVWAQAGSEPTAVAAGTASMLAKLDLIYAHVVLHAKVVNQTLGTETLRNEADSADLAQATVSDDGTIFTRGTLELATTTTTTAAP